MFKHVLIATDGSELADQAAAQGFELAKVLNAKVTVVTVTKSWAAAVPERWFWHSHRQNTTRQQQRELP